MLTPEGLACLCRRTYSRVASSNTWKGFVNKKGLSASKIRITQVCVSEYASKL